MKNNFLPLLLAITASGIASCKDKTKQIAPEIPAISDSIVTHVQTTKAELADNNNEIKLNGKIEADETKTAKVYALVSGKIQTVTATLGDYVQKGQTLAVLKSTEVAGTANDLSLAESNLEMAKKSLQTTKDLYEGNLASEQDFLNAKMTYNKALSELNRARQVSQIAGGRNATFTVTAPISGYIIDKNISGNSEIRQDNNAALFTIADLSTVWVTANVYETDIAGIHLNDDVIVNTLANPAKDYPGKINKVFNVLDPATRTMQVRVSMQNSNKELKPEMFATVKVKIHSTGKTLTIPAQALVMDNSKYYTIVKKNGKLQVQQVELLKRNEEKAYIQGLNEGDEIVTGTPIFIYQALTAE